MKDAFEEFTSLPLAKATTAQQSFPLTLTQQSLWAWDQTTSLRHPTHDPLCLRLNGPLNIEALLASLNMLLQRHRALCATFPMFDGQPRQVIDPEMHLALPLVDLRSISGDLREERLQAALFEEARTPFHLAKGPLV